VKVPRVKLVVQRSCTGDADEVAGEQNRSDSIAGEERRSMAHRWIRLVLEEQWQQPPCRPDYDYSRKIFF